MTDRSKLNEAMDRFTRAIDRAYRWRITNCGSYIADNENSYDKAALAVIKVALAESKDAEVVMKAMMLEINNLKAELARYRPLIEAAGVMSKERLVELVDIIRQQDDTELEYLFRAALAYKSQER